MTFKVRLLSGRELGPIDLDRISKLIRKKHIIGEEMGQGPLEGPDADLEWKPIRRIPEIAGLLPQKESTEALGQKPTLVLRSLPGIESEQRGISPFRISAQSDDPLEPTVVAEDPTVLAEPTQNDVGLAFESEPTAKFRRNLSQEPTIVFSHQDERTDTQDVTPHRGKLPKLNRTTVIVFVLIALGVYQWTEETRPPVQPPIAFKPAFPSPDPTKADPAKAKSFFDQGIRHYVEDTIEGYQNASKYFLASANLDFTNIRALGLLASSYIQLVDSTSQDAEYFAVIIKLLEIVRAKGPNIPETVIADAEFYQLLGKHDSAIQRINEYTKTYPNYGREMFYYVAEAAFGKKDARLAAKMLTEVSDKSAFSPKVFYLRAQVAEALGEYESALSELKRALELKPKHAKSMLKVAEIFSQQGRLRDAEKELVFLVNNPQLLAPQALARAFFLHAKLMMLSEKWKQASASLERSTVLDRNNRDYAIEYYSVLGRIGGLGPQLKRRAQMYFLLVEGEKLFAQESYEQALALFLRAREVDRESYLPPLRIGETFVKQYLVEEALLNFRKAYELDPRRIEVSSRLCKALIDTYAWDEAKRMIDKLSTLPGGRSPADKLLGDLYAKQSLYVEALIHYRRAMTRDTIDPELYNAYARALLDAQSPDNAPMFFGLARRFDPKNADAIVGTAEALALTEGADIGIRFLRKELESTLAPRPEFLAAIAELHQQKGDWKESQRIAQQVVTDYPTFVRGYWVLGKIHWQSRDLSKDKAAAVKAIQAFRRYSERNPTDPSGYIELYKIHLSQKKYDLAEQELNSVVDRYPKFPNLYVYRGDLFTMWGNLMRAAQEYQQEIKNHPTSAIAMLALGRTYLDMQKYDEALRQFAEAMRNAPKASEPKYYAGYTQYLLKNYTGAVAMLLSATQIDQGNPLIYKRLGDAYVALGQVDKAREAYSRYLSLAPDAPDRAEVEKF